MIPVLALALSLAWQNAWGSTVDAASSLHASPIVLTGTLRPATLSVNGRPLSIKSRGARALLINGKPVEARGDLGTFYESTEASRLELAWEWEEGAPPEPIATLAYPAILALRVSPSRAEIGVDERTRSLSTDGAELPLEGRSAWVPISTDGAWLAADHALELRAEDGGSRVYSLTLGDLRERVLSDWRVGVSTQ